MVTTPHAGVINKAPSFSIQFDESKKHGVNWLALGLTWCLDSVRDRTLFSLSKLAAVKDASGTKLSSSTSAAYAQAICGKLREAGLDLSKAAFTVCDSCSVNSGRLGGVVALVNQWLGLWTFFAHCLLHILHNGVETALTKGFKKDPTKQRQGGNSPVIFLLEQVSKSVRDNWDELKLKEEGVSKPPEGCQTRWWSYGRVAIQLLQHHNSAYSAIDKEIAGTREPSQAWVKLLKGLTDETLLAQVHILAEFGLAFCKHEFLFIESGDSRHALIIHKRLKRAYCLRAAIIGLPETYFPKTLQFANSNSLPNETVLELIKSFTETFVDYFRIRTAFWFEPPFLFAGLDNPSTRRDTAKESVRREEGQTRNS
jgi:hypothetical protein